MIYPLLWERDKSICKYPISQFVSSKHLFLQQSYITDGDYARISSFVQEASKDESWEIIERQGGKKPVGCRWIYMFKLKAVGTLVWYNTRQYKRQIENLLIEGETFTCCGLYPTISESHSREKTLAQKRWKLNYGSLHWCWWCQFSKWRKVNFKLLFILVLKPLLCESSGSIKLWGWI
jgi:hypothetical protein